MSVSMTELERRLRIIQSLGHSADRCIDGAQDDGHLTAAQADTLRTTLR